MTPNNPLNDSTDLTIFQQAFVADHIADLEREGAALRAERARDAQLVTDATADPSRRIRLGRWLVALGEAIAGDGHSADDAPTGLTRAA
jgi:hypothetical protein